MSMRGGLSKVFTETVAKYIVFQFNNPPLVTQAGDYDVHDEVFVQDPKGLIKVVDELSQLNEEVVAIDGSSRSFFFSQGVVSVSSVVAFSNTRGALLTFPSFGGMKGLDQDIPFISIATPFTNVDRIEDFVLPPSVSKFSTQQLNINDQNALETELRFSLETACIERLKDKQFVLIDGPLIPRFIYLNKKISQKLIERRKSTLNRNLVGIVKRVNRSSILVNAMRKDDNYFYSTYGINPHSFSSDEALLTHLARKIQRTPNRPFIVGPVIRKQEELEITSHYVVVPFHPFVEKFSILRIESISNSFLPETLLSIPMSFDGIPLPLALADKLAKEISSAVFSLLIQDLQQMGMQASFYSRLEGLGL
ncbi:DNA double-strand break repair nuclease NurA [Metallosphaera tengchongensis]|uniref:DNA double-strand break repair nuclease NurA n=1 Tax=Metallosphaera tengchongensis TaxID=1532350 RepID=A0A6N0NVF9_9CREN|nr:DNA double-strand break repair nuclease NurA [Metallosphaera tengchongensis]QKQ99678.1 DNA double-strand break repair nuclease NurA [Metallosphaera tengchongensis]